MDKLAVSAATSIHGKDRNLLSGSYFECGPRFLPRRWRCGNVMREECEMKQRRNRNPAVNRRRNRGFFRTKETKKKKIC